MADKKPSITRIDDEVFVENADGNIIFVLRKTKRTDCDIELSYGFPSVTLYLTKAEASALGEAFNLV